MFCREKTKAWTDYFNQSTLFSYTKNVFKLPPLGRVRVGVRWFGSTVSFISFPNMPYRLFLYGVA